MANLQLSLPLHPLAAPTRCFQLAPTRPLLGSTEGRLPRLGSVWLRSARPVADLRLASGAPHFRSTDGDPSGLHRTTPPPARPAISADSHRILTLQLGWLEQPQAFAVGCCSFRLAPSAAATFQLAPVVAPFAKPAVNFRLASAVSPSGFTGFDSPGLRLALLPPAGPLTRP